MNQFEINTFESESREKHVEPVKSLSQSLVNRFNGEPNKTPQVTPGQRFLKKKTKPSQSQYRLQAFLHNTEPSKLDRLDHTWKEQLQ